MFKSYLRIALRSLLRNKLYSALNIIGLAVGLASCLLIALFVLHELSFDRFHANSSRIYRITREKIENDKISVQANTPPAVAPALGQEFADVEATVRFMAPYPSSALVRNGETKFYEKGFAWVDASVFSVFSFPLLQGNPQTALTDPFTVVLSESLARKYFGAENPIGKTLTIHAWTQEEYRVTGVFRDIPAVSHLHFDCLASFRTAEQRYTRMFTNPEAMWRNNLVYSYVLLKSPEAASNLAGQLPSFAKRHLGAFEAKQTTKVSFGMQALTAIHLDANVKPLFEVNGDKKTVYIFVSIAVFILLLACVNFVNLSTARSTRRAREIGVRKAVGAERRQIIAQFLGESLLTSLIASALAVLLAELALPAFTALSGIQLPSVSAALLSWGVKGAVACVGVIVGVGIVAGVYPALYVSGFSAALVFKGASVSGRGKSVVRKVLVVAQFSIAIVLVIGMLTMRKQLDFMRSEALGFTKEHVVVLPVRDDELFKQTDAFKSALMANASIHEVSAASGVPGQNMLSDRWTVTADGREETKQEMFTVMCDADYANAMGLQMSAGRWFAAASPADATDAFVINETAVRTFGFGTPEKALGKQISTMQNKGKKGVIIGVVKDIHFSSLKTAVQPTLFHIDAGMFACFAVRISGGTVSEALHHIKTSWSALAPKQPFDYVFLDEAFAAQYAADERLERVIVVFSWLAVIVACLGLFGLASFAAEIRTKEIAVRKVLGASTFGITALLGREFIVLIAIAFLVACPLGYMLMNKWLQDFAYRITIGADILMLSGAVAFGAALMAILWQTLKAAKESPVNALKNE